jgi:hypothetical protein
VRGCATIERGPLVHALEGAVDDARLDPRAVGRPHLLGVVTVDAGLRVWTPAVSP